MTFDLQGQGFKRDPLPTFTIMRAAGSVVPGRIPIIGKTSFATTHHACEILLKDKARFVVDPRPIGKKGLRRFPWWFPKRFRPLTENMLGMDDPDHQRLRHLVDKAFLKRHVQSYEPMIERIADRMLDDLQAADDGDLVRHVARPLPLAVISELLGLPHEDSSELTHWMRSISTASSILDVFRLFPALEKLARYLRQHFDTCRAAPRIDLISALVAVEEEGDQLSEDELLAMCFTLFVAGHETTTHLISGGVLALLQHPAQLARLRRHENLMSPAVDELLRFVSPVQISKPRYATENTEIDGTPIKQGERLMAVLASGNADPGIFERPESLDLERRANRHLAFGHGPHFCLGAQLARAEMAIILQRLFDRFPDLRLAVPEEDLRWTRRIGLRALQSLPLQLV